MFVRMPWGLKGAVAHFQKSVWVTCVRQGESWVVVYIDDIVVVGSTQAEVWERTKEVVARLTAAGFKLNLNKSMFVTESVEVVGFLVERNLYQVGRKALDRLMKAQLPTDFK